MVFLRCKTLVTTLGSNRAQDFSREGWGHLSEEVSRLTLALYAKRCQLVGTNRWVPSQLSLTHNGPGGGQLPDVPSLRPPQTCHSPGFSGGQDGPTSPQALYSGYGMAPKRKQQLGHRAKPAFITIETGSCPEAGDLGAVLF